MKNARGVAMVTVLMAGAALTAVTSVAAIVAVRDFRAGRADRFGAEALAYGDAGIDAMISHLKSGKVLYADIYSAGCGGSPAGTAWETSGLTLPTSQVGTQGSFDAVLRVFNNNATSRDQWFGTTACSNRAGFGEPLHVGILSTGRGPSSAASRRELLQVLRLTPSGLPIGHYAVSISVNGNPDMRGVSMISETSFSGRNKVSFSGTDPYFKLGSFWPGNTWPGGRSAADRMPAAAHAVGGITIGAASGTPEFAAGVPNCDANNAQSGVASQSLWDSDGSAFTLNASGGPRSTTTPLPEACSGQVGYPPHARFTADDVRRVVPAPRLTEEQYRELKEAAQLFGLYCNYGTTTSYCTIRNGPPFNPPVNFANGTIAPLIPPAVGGTPSFIAYFDFTNGLSPLANSVRWTADNVWPCAYDSTTGLPTSANRNVTIVVRNGGFQFATGGRLNGAVLAQDGIFTYSGGPVVNGTILAQQIQMTGGATFSIDDCWVATRAAVFSSVTPFRWAEIDR
jgi:hypothetical protein